ncbi:AraC family transcriptional regulator [Sphingobacterium sp. ML3W]|uniref:helix-turn-helix domain-containing protein n=1 Tax=Sphingobacterium sp. ML3W TaxID=1538644 RepID=UPI00249A1EA0|nr:AraC family transcriptional regulator [Sphingobacterium sp. ML3W]WFA80913.1 AraC family transcriptional regulator [Sphingobacterium sp. ML3W]
MKDKQITKDLDWESSVKDDITYLPLLGASENSNFWAPDSYVFLFFEECRGWHSIDLVEYEDKDNQVHISFPGQIHSWKTEAESKGHKLILSKNFVETRLIKSVFTTLYLNNCPVIDMPKDIAEKVFFELTMIGQDIGKVTHHIVSLRVQLVLTLIGDLIENELDNDIHSGDRASWIVSKFLKLLEIHFREEKTVAFYAKSLGIAPDYLSVLVRRKLNKTPKDLITKRVSLEGQRLLLGSALSIKEISYTLGFPTLGAFSTFMKINSGMSPKMLREELYESTSSYQ